MTCYISGLSFCHKVYTHSKADGRVGRDGGRGDLLAVSYCGPGDKIKRIPGYDPRFHLAFNS